MHVQSPLAGTDGSPGAQHSALGSANVGFDGASGYRCNFWPVPSQCMHCEGLHPSSVSNQLKSQSPSPPRWPWDMKRHPRQVPSRSSLSQVQPSLPKCSYSIKSVLFITGCSASQAHYCARLHSPAAGSNLESKPSHASAERAPVPAAQLQPTVVDH